MPLNRREADRRADRFDCHEQREHDRHAGATPVGRVMPAPNPGEDRDRRQRAAIPNAPTLRRPFNSGRYSWSQAIARQRRAERQRDADGADRHRHAHARIANLAAENTAMTREHQRDDTREQRRSPFVKS